jgi:hypothetical protein
MHRPHEKLDAAMGQKSPARKKPSRRRTKTGRDATTGASAKTLTARQRRFLDPSFTQQLVEHMHRAKKAAIAAQE